MYTRHLCCTHRGLYTLAPEVLLFINGYLSNLAFSFNHHFYIPSLHESDLLFHSYSRYKCLSEWMLKYPFFTYFLLYKRVFTIWEKTLYLAFQILKKNECPFRDDLVKESNSLESQSVQTLNIIIIWFYKRRISKEMRYLTVLYRTVG